MARFIDMLNDQAKAEDMQALSMRGIGEQDADDFLEKTYWESPEPDQIAAGQQNFNEPEKAEPLAKSVTVAKESGQQGGIGIVPAIMAGLAGAFSDNGVETTSKLMKEWDPARQAAVAKERQGKAQKVEADRLDMERTAQGRDAESEISRGQMKDYAAMFDGMGMPQLGSMFVGKSEEQQDKMFASLAPQLKNAIGKDERSLDRDVKIQYNKEMQAQTKAKTAATAQNRTDVADAKVAAANLLVKAKTEKRYNDAKMKEYETLANSEAKYPATIRDVDRIIELGDNVETGPIAGSDPAVYLRKLFGDNELQELESLVKGLPLPILKATFGSAFTVMEGQTLATSLANVKMDAQAFRNAMGRMRENVEYSHNEYNAQSDYLDANNGSLKGYRTTTPLAPKAGSNDQEGTKRTNRRTGEVQIMQGGQWVTQ